MEDLHEKLPAQPAPEVQSAEERIAAVAERVRALAEAGGVHALNTGVDLLRGLHPADQGRAILNVNDTRRGAVLQALGPERAARVLEHLDPVDAARTLGGVRPEAIAQLLDEAPPEVAADVLHQLPRDLSLRAQDALADPHEVLVLLQYADETAGGIMTPDYPVVRDSVTTGAALDVLRLIGPEAEDVSSLFVVDGSGRLVGALGVIPLALARPSSLVRDIMGPAVATVTAGTDQEECVRLMQRYTLNQLPVVDADGRLVGVITGDEAVDVAEEEATEDMFNLSGMGGERLSGPLLGSVRHRLPWLSVNLGTTILAATVISLFESTIARVAVLAAFLPIVAGQGGIGGTQTLTLVVRSMALGGMPPGRGLRVLGREVALGLAHGLLMGVAVGLVGYVWKGSYMLGLVLGAAMLGNMVVAGFAGAGVPLILRRLKLDPAVSSAVFVTTFTDVLGFLFFLGLAALLIEHLAV